MCNSRVLATVFLFWVKKDLGGGCFKLGNFIIVWVDRVLLGV